MSTAQVEFSEEVYETLQRIAHARKQTVEEVLAEAIGREEYLTDHNGEIFVKLPGERPRRLVRDGRGVPR